MLARKWSLESCSDACSPSRMWSELGRRQDRRDRGFADVATPSGAEALDQPGEGADPGGAETISNSSARDWLKCSHSALDCSTPSASSSCLSSGTHEPHDVPACVHFFSSATSQQPPAMASVRSPLVTLLHEQICAAARQRADAELRAPPSVPAGAISASGSPGSSLADHRPQHAVGRRVADQDAAEQRLGVVGEHQLGVGLVDRVVDDDLEAVRGGAHRVAEARHVDAEQLELGGHVGLGELGRAAEQPVGDHLGAGVAGADEAVAAALDRGHLADREDRRDRAVAQDKSVSTPPRSASSSPASRASSSRGRTPAAKIDHARRRSTVPSLKVTRTSRLGGSPRPAFQSIVGADVGVHRDAELADHPAQQCAARLVELLRHQPRRPLDDVGVKPEPAQRVGGLQAEQAAADHHADRRPAGARRAARRRGSRRGRRGCGRRGSAGRSWPGTGGTNAYEPVASTSAS